MNLMIPKENIMINKFKHYTLADLGTVITGKTPSTSNPSFWNGNIPFITPKDLQTTKHIIKTERTITDYGRNSIKGCILPKDSISVSCIGNLGYVGKTTKESVTNQQINSIIPNNLVDSDFLYYLLKSMWSYFKHYEGQSTALSILNKTQFEKIQVNIPEDIDVQKKIAGVLSALDDKIELNNQINSNLEQQAQALFKSWFIDFEPFDGKMPNDWKQYKIKEFVPVITGKKNANVSSNTGKYPFFSCSQTIARTNEYSFNGRAILVAGNGDFNVKFYDGKFEAYQRTYVLIPYQQQLAAWLFYAIKYNLNNIISSARGSVISFITKGSLEESVIAAPRKINNMPIMETLSKIADIILHKIKENQRLSEIRDSLLPKLMSGEIDMSKVDISDLI